MIKPGEKSPGGKYQQIKKSGKSAGETAKVPRGKTMPPTDKKGRSWKKITKK